jgi:uncharacterized protein YutE (UPF0331/DUF86 family)
VRQAMGKNVRYDEERIGTLFSDINKYIGDFEELDILQLQDLHDKRNFYAVSMVLFSLLNRVFDLGSEMAIANNLGIPSTYREIFVLLGKKDLIDHDLEKNMIELVTYRNLLSHEYHGITEENLFDLTKRIETIKKFVELMQKKIHDRK